MFLKMPLSGFLLGQPAYRAGCSAAKPGAVTAAPAELFRLQEAEIKLHANRNVPVRDSTKYVMSTIYNCITETESDLLVDPYLNSLRSPPGKGRG